MYVLIIYVALMLAFDVLDYGIGTAVEAMWGGNVSLVVFLACYFGTLYLAWAIAWRLAERMRLTT